MRFKAENRRGIVAVIVAVSLVALLGTVAIAVDGGLLLDDKRKGQVAADAAALAAACDLFGQLSAGGTGLDSSGTGSASALSTAAANGFNNDGVNSVVTVNIPPKSGNFVGVAGYAEVIVQNNQKRRFSNIFGSGRLPVKARAVGCGLPGNIGILILDPTITVAAQIVGNINIQNGGQIYCNSNNTVLNDEFKGYGKVGGVYLESTANLTCGGINVVGSLSQETGSTLKYTNGGGLQTGVGPWSDPLASIPEPVLPSGAATTGNYTSNTTINPGLFNKITIGGAGGPGGPGGGPPGPGGGPAGPGGGSSSTPTVTMNPGIYYITGGITISSGSLVGNGVMIYNTSGDKLDFQNATSVNLTPPTSGTYRGISIFQPRSDTREVHIESTGPVTISGTMYAQSGEFDIRPDGSTTVFNMGNYICDQAEWAQGYSTGGPGGGKSNGIINFNPYTAAPTERPVLVE